MNNNTKAIIDFSGYNAGELGPIAHNIRDKMLLNVATFATPSISLVTFQTQITSYDAKLIARASNATTDLLAFNDARNLLEQSLSVLGNYANSIAKGDPVVVDKSGFPFYDTNHTPNAAIPAGPTDLRLRHGDLSGSMVARYKADRQPSTNEVQSNTSDPNLESAWHLKGMYQGGRAEMEGFTPGTIVWIRVRTVGLKGVMGAWSDPAQIRML